MAHDNMGRVPPATGVTARLPLIGPPLRQVERRPVEVVGEPLVPARNIADRHGGRRRRLPGGAPGDESYRNDHHGEDTGRDPCREPRPRSTLPSGATRGRPRATGGHLGAGDRDLLYRSGSCYERALTGRARRPHGWRLAGVLSSHRYGRELLGDRGGGFTVVPEHGPHAAAPHAGHAAD